MKRNKSDANEMLLVPSYIGKKRYGTRNEMISLIEQKPVKPVITSCINYKIPQAAFLISHGKNNNTIHEISFNKECSKIINRDSVAFKHIGDSKLKMYFLDDPNQGYYVYNRKSSGQKVIRNKPLVKMMIAKYGIDEDHAFATVNNITNKSCIINFIDKQTYENLKKTRESYRKPNPNRIIAPPRPKGKQLF